MKLPGRPHEPAEFAIRRQQRDPRRVRDNGEHYGRAAMVRNPEAETQDDVGEDARLGGPKMEAQGIELFVDHTNANGSQMMPHEIMTRAPRAVRRPFR